MDLLSRQLQIGPVQFIPKEVIAMHLGFLGRISHLTPLNVPIF